ncbi:ATP-binding protein [Pedobacter sp. BS3]|uniref:ATP-binding protein n=1 Tax=Pedobacter sp. BS3 TaxID=2567937 RepID=UPI0011EC98EC|nr:ATP-binding protein [Pedobacter sp. BS3]TZF81053.1 ATP-binding protein [Pedobacter sp. BS3]
MLLKSEIETAYLLQQAKLQNKEIVINRDSANLVDIKSGAVQIVSGIRRCGKSTLLRGLMKNYRKTAFLNFEDPRIFGFRVSDFPKLDEIIPKNTEAYFFDEIQNVPQWELYVRQLHDDGKKVFITGSNASMLSRDLGTRLTGRYLNTELFPFSYTEYLRYNKEKKSEISYQNYLTKGGFPEFLVSENPEILQNLLKDIVYRDIAVRYGIRNANTLVNITLFLLSNIGKETSFNSLKKAFEVGSANSISDYLSWLEDAYLLFFLQKFSWSAKSRQISPKKVYAIDNGLAKANTLSFTSDYGRLLENQVFIYLRTAGKTLYYFREVKECDFVVFNQNKCIAAIQVCYELTTDNKDREINGLAAAMDFFSLKKGYIVTLSQQDSFHFNEKEIVCVPAHVFFSEDIFQV